MRIAVIPARGGSTRIPRKNIKLFHGKPIICYSIETARASGLFDRIVVTTDDDEIANIAREQSVGVLMRDPALAQNWVGTQAVARNLLEIAGQEFDTACVIYATAPLMSVDSIKWGLYEMQANPSLAYAFSVGYPPLQDAAQFYWGGVEAFLVGKPLVWPNVAMIPIPAERVCDINTPEDWIKAEEMYARLHGIETRSQAMERVGLSAEGRGAL